MIPNNVSTYLKLKYFYFEDNNLWITSDEKLVTQTKRKINKIDLIAPADVYDACVVRQHKAYPVYDDTYTEHVKMIHLNLKIHFPNLHLVNHNNIHKYNNQDHTIMTSLLTTKNIIASKTLHDI